jgi:hypothetical protein
MTAAYLTRQLAKMTVEQLRERCTPECAEMTKEQIIQKIVEAEFGTIAAGVICKCDELEPGRTCPMHGRIR